MSPNPSSPSKPSKWLSLLAVCLAAAAMPLTFTGTAVALPAIGHALGGSPVAIAWITSAFMLTFGSTLMAIGAMADSHGRKRVFLVGAAAFAAFSLALVFAPDILIFDLLRAGQGLAASAAYAGGMAALAQVFEGPSRLRAYSIVGTSFGVGLSLGPVVCGLMIEAFGWRSIFLVVMVLAALAFALGAKTLEENRDPASRGLDWPGAITFTAALALFSYGVLLAPQHGWGSSPVTGLLTGAALFLLAFVLIERRVSRPMLDLSLFRYPRFVGAQLLAAAPAYGFVVLLILLPVRFIGIEGMDPVVAGSLMIALSAPLLVLPLVAGVLVRWFRPATICGAGLFVSACGLLWLAQTPVGAPIWMIAMPMFVIGVGISQPWGLMDGLAVSVVPKERAGMATGIFSTTRVAGESLALVVVLALLSAFISSAMGEAHMQGDIPTAAQRLAAGNIGLAQAALPASQKTALVATYADAFGELLFLLAAITFVTALFVFLFLDRGAERSASEDKANTSVGSCACESGCSNASV
jgi:MFS family permease